MSSINSGQRTNQNKSELRNYPSLELHRENILIVIKTYPRPSKSYRELVCTAGITRQGKWIRLYPIDYRYMDYGKWYKKYQWISIEIEKNIEDKRVDSYRPNPKSIKILSQPLDTKNNWKKRKDIVIPTLHHSSLEAIQEEYNKNKISLAIFKPRKIIDFVVEKEKTEWSNQHQQVLSQLRLFERQPKLLEKIPFKFSYKFVCNDKKCNTTHKLSIIDWEIYSLYRNIKKNYPYEIDEILEKIRYRYIDEMWSNKKNSYLIVGTRYPYPTFMVLGVFWPPKKN